MRAVFYGFMFVCAMGGVAMADVVQRTDCAAVNAKITELSAIESPDDATTEQLTALQNQYRRDCTKRAAGRRTSGRGVVVTASVVTDESEIEVAPEQKIEEDKEYVCDVPDEHGCCPSETYTDKGEEGWVCCQSDGGVCFPPMAPEMTEEEKMALADANLEKGLCTDGSQPNKFGCCGDEVFKDLGDAVFACCNKSGDCYPPLK